MAKSDYTDMAESYGFTPNEDMELEGVNDTLFYAELDDIRLDLREDYQLDYSNEEVLELLEEYNIDLVVDGLYTVADLLYAEIEKDIV